MTEPEAVALFLRLFRRNFSASPHNYQLLQSSTKSELLMPVAIKERNLTCSSDYIAQTYTKYKMNTRFQILRTLDSEL
jgi:hypothetical protein